MIDKIYFKNYYRKNIKQTLLENQERQVKLEEEISMLNNELATKQEEFTNLRLKKEELELKVQTTPNIERTFNFLN